MRTRYSRHKLALVCALTLVGLVCLMHGAVLAATPSAAPQSDVRIHAEPEHPMLPSGGAVEIKITATKKGTPLASAGLSARLEGGTPGEVRLDDSGTAGYRFQATPEMETGVHAVEFREPASGTVRKFYVDVVDQKTYDAFDETAKKIKPEATPAHYLFIGDSLTDMFRGRNYVDKVDFWLWKIHGSQATVRNAGVGGDFILRVWQRLNKDPSSYRLNMYDNLYEPLPTRVFFFLGHNDSKLTSRSEYKQPVVPLEEFEEKYRLAIRKIQAETKARITVLSATSSVYEITKATSARRLAQGKANNLFGKPEALEQFNAVARKIAGQCGADYLDVYEPTRRHPDKQSLFTRDGVHVNNNGNRLLALEILKYLAGK